MKKRKISFFAIFILLFFSIAAYPFDIGGTLDNSTSFVTPKLPSATRPVSQSDKLSLWINEAGKHLRFDLQGSYTFSLERYYLFDLDTLDFAGQFLLRKNSWPSFSFDLGRLYFSDFTANILANKIDGVQLALGMPFLNVKAAFGYAGSFQKPTSSIIMSKSDVADRLNEAELWAAKRLVGLLELKFPDLFLRQDLMFSFIFQQDLRPDANLTAGGGRYYSQYEGAGISGTIVPLLYWDSFFYLETGKTYNSTTGGYDSIIAFLTGGGLRFYMDKVLYSKIGLKFVYSSGDGDYRSFFEGNTDKSAHAFLPIARPAAALIFTPQLSNIFYGEVSYSIKPFSFAQAAWLKNFQILLKGLPFFKSSAGPISEPGTNTSASTWYLGTEADLIINFRPVSDIGLGVSGGYFFANNGTDGAFLADQQPQQFMIRGELSLSF
ncbi:MAG: hypothetical protein AB1798_16065 [Spirochaetota bacterium]